MKISRYFGLLGMLFIVNISNAEAHMPDCLGEFCIRDTINREALIKAGFLAKENKYEGYTTYSIISGIITLALEVSSGAPHQKDGEIIRIVRTMHFNIKDKSFNELVKLIENRYENGKRFGNGKDNARYRHDEDSDPKSEKVVDIFRDLSKGEWAISENILDQRFEKQRLDKFSACR